MTAQYYSVFTEQGLSLLREAIQNGTKLGITKMSFGDGNGYLPSPEPNVTSLVNEVYQTSLNSLAPDPSNSNWLRAEAIIASAVGGFNIRELGLWAGDVLVAYSNYPPTYKPNPADGTARIMTFRMILQIDNTANFELKIDADIVMATIRAVEEAKQQAIQHADDLSKKQIENVETISDLENVSKLNGKSVFVKGFTEGYPTGNGVFTYYEDKADINDGGIIINGWCRNIGDVIFASYFNDDIVKAANYAASAGLKLISLEKEYFVTEEFVLPENLVWLSNNSTIVQSGNALNSSSASVIAPMSNVTIQGTLTLDMGQPTAGWGEKAHCRVDSFNNVIPKVRGFYFDTLILKGGYHNCNGFVMAGGASLVRGKRIECGDSSLIGRVFMAHWGNFVDHRLVTVSGAKKYTHAENWRPTTHPHDCIIDEIYTGNLTCNSTDYSGVALVSAGYDIEIKSINGHILDHAISGKALLLLTPGDLAFAYASENEKSHGMRNIRVGKVLGTTHALGVGLLDIALFANADDYTNVATPPSRSDYLAKISAEVDFMSCSGKVEVGNSSNILINGGTGGGSLYVKKAIGKYFYSCLYARNRSNNVVIDELIAIDNKTNPVSIIGTGDDPSQFPKNTRIKRLILERYGITSSNNTYRSAVKNDKAINTQIDEIILNEHGNAYCVAAVNNSNGYGFRIGSIIQNDVNYPNDFLISNSNNINDPIQLDNFIDKSSRVIKPISGGVSVRQNGQVKEYMATYIPNGLSVSAGDKFLLINVTPGVVFEYKVTTSGIIGDTAVLQKNGSVKTYLTILEPISLLSKETKLIRAAGAISGLKMGDFLQLSYSKKLFGCFLYADIYSDGNYDVYLYNPNNSAIEIEAGTIYIKQS
ncbi:TPA: phage tail protein [Acinetobacter baumannii]|nr:phage tail protein [Acinetobacter baumannii]